jgi:phosphoribosyl 1,2-cyclic phosphodiesterase
MRVKVWGARGSIPSPGPETTRFGGNTSCVEVTLSDGTTIVLDGGTGLRSLGLRMAGGGGQVNILLTHLHLDHIQGLMFFAPAFNPDSELVIWGPEAPDAPLLDRIARYISAPLAPVEVRELPCRVAFKDAPHSEWQIGPATVRAASVTHRGPTLGYRITEGDTSLCYIPDHEPALAGDLERIEAEWLSGYELAREATLLVHDCQYTDEEYPRHVGWGHSALSHTLAFARRTLPERLLLFHHDPMHTDDFLDAFHAGAVERWTEGGGSADQILIAAEGQELDARGELRQPPQARSARR